MISIPVIALELSIEGVIVCRVEKGKRLHLLGYHLHAEDEQKNPHNLVLIDGRNIIVCIPTTESPSPVGVILPSPIPLAENNPLRLGIIKAPKIIPAKAWGTVWVR